MGGGALEFSATHLVGAKMQKRLLDMLLGTEDAVPGDYVLALVAVVGLMVAVLVELVV